MGKATQKIFQWLSTTKSLVFLRRGIGHLLSYSNILILNYSSPDRAKVIGLIRNIRYETSMLLTYIEAYQIFITVKRTEKIEGDVAEVGVYKGGSAKLICEAKGHKHFHLFDTFEGLPKLSKTDNFSQFHEGQFDVSLENVKNYLNKYPNLHFYKGMFPTTADPLKEKKFSFVNLDVDIYESTLNCLEFFYPKMTKGGIIISHDYFAAIGVRKAFDAFFLEKPEPVLELSGSQCMIVKI